MREIATVLVALQAHSLSAADLEGRLRRLETPVIVRVADDQVLMDVRTLDPDEISMIRGSLKAVLAKPEA